jgi:beta-1,4-N-acetylglucosaminyltransferase
LQKSSNRNAQTVVIFAGAGGHLAQSQKFISKLLEETCQKGISCEIVRMTDVLVGATDDELIQIGELRPKHPQGLFHRLSMLFTHFVMTNRACAKVGKTRPRLYISFGPGSAILCSLFFKLYGVRIVHIESWSRFTTRSFTGLIMHKIADEFFVQNRSLLDVYPGAKWVGRLG